jgi:hypothetical protein
MVNNSRELRETVDRLNPCDFRLLASSQVSVDSVSQSSDQLSYVTVSESEEDADDIKVISSLAEAYKSAMFPQSQLHSTPVDYQVIDSRMTCTLSDKVITPLSVNNPSYSSLDVSENETVPDPLTESIDFIMPHLVPDSPAQQTCILDATCMDEFFDLPQSTIKLVPLVEPGARITEDEFAEAILGIDFSRVFD